jgi:hypothetical protein
MNGSILKTLDSETIGTLPVTEIISVIKPERRSRITKTALEKIEDESSSEEWTGSESSNSSLIQKLLKKQHSVFSLSKQNRNHLRSSHALFSKTLQKPSLPVSK